MLTNSNPIKKSTADAMKMYLVFTLSATSPATRPPIQKKLIASVKVRERAPLLQDVNSAEIGLESTLHA